MLSVVSRRRDLQKPDLIEVLSAFCTSSRRGADRRWGFGAGLQAFPTIERYLLSFR